MCQRVLTAVFSENALVDVGDGFHVFEATGLDAVDVDSGELEELAFGLCGWCQNSAVICDS